MNVSSSTRASATTPHASRAASAPAAAGGFAQQLKAAKDGAPEPAAGAATTSLLAPAPARAAAARSTAELPPAQPAKAG